MDYKPPRVRLSATAGLHRAEMAERDLRARLLEDPTTPAQLIAPEQATAQVIDENGTLLGATTGPLPGAVFGWAPESDWLPLWLHAPHVLAELEAEDYEPDPSCDQYAAHGSCLLHRPRVTRLLVSPFLAPVAEQWHRRWGVEVEVLTGEDVPPPEVPVLPAVVLPGLFDAETCRALWDYYLQATDDGIEGLPCDGIAAPAEAVQAVTDVLVEVAGHLELPLHRTTGQLMNYLPGERFQEHTDATDALALSLDRTLSASVLLNSAGTDYLGGDLFVAGERIEAAAGDAVVFTAATPHRVTEVREGHRFVLVMFGEVIR